MKKSDPTFLRMLAQSKTNGAFRRLMRETLDKRSYKIYSLPNKKVVSKFYNKLRNK